MMPMVDRATSRRRFIQYLAASPLFASTSLAALADERDFPKLRPDPYVWAPRDYDHLIADPKEALDVFDFEPVMRILRTELKVAMQQVGAPSLKDLKPAMVLHV